MGKAQHTPGPWATHRGKVFTTNPDASILERGAGICSTFIDSANDQEGFANARLIAAAPDLLISLELACAALEGNEAAATIRKSGLAAIAKARGQA